MGLTIAIVLLSVVILISLKALKNTARDLRRHVPSWDTLRSVVGEDENYTSEVCACVCGTLQEDGNTNRMQSGKSGQIGRQVTNVDMSMMRQMKKLNLDNGFSGQAILD